MECPICRHDAVYHLDGCLAGGCECEKSDTGLYQDRIDELETQLAALSWVRWIPVTERLPDLHLSISNGFMYESDKYLVCGEGWVHFGRLYASDDKADTWWWDRRHGQIIHDVIAYMELPPAYQPEQDTKGDSHE